MFSDMGELSNVKRFKVILQRALIIEEMSAENQGILDIGCFIKKRGLTVGAVKPGKRSY